VRVADPVAQPPDDKIRVHMHPEEMTRIDVRGNSGGNGRKLLEGLHIVGDRAGMKLEADHQIGMGLDRERTDVGPVILDPLVPLALIDVLQIGQPAAAGKMRRHVARRSRGAAGHANDPIDAALGGQPDRVAQRGIMRLGDALVRMHRVAPAVESADFETAALDLLLIAPPRPGILEQPRHVAMGGGGVGASTDLQPGQFGGGFDHPIHDLHERLAGHRLGDHPDLDLRVSHSVHTIWSVPKEEYRCRSGLSSKPNIQRSEKG
jgi:hypothetical protein